MTQNCYESALGSAATSRPYPMFFFDPILFAWLNADLQTPGWSIETARFYSQWVPNLSGVAVALGLTLGSPALRRSLLLLLCALALAWCVSRLIRWGFPMPRPFQLNLGMRWLEHGGRASFPSMHACGAFAVAQAVSLGYTRRWRWLVLLAWSAALGVAWSRVHLGVHFPSDLMAGAAVGCLSAWCVWGCAWARRPVVARSVPVPLSAAVS